jgi:hypothetical protein
MRTEALRVPITVGAKVTLNVQVALTATLPPQVLVTLKSPGSAPPIAILVMLNAVFPVFVKLTTCAVLVVFNV